MKTELLSFYGNDKMVCDTARVSFGKIKDEFDEKDIKLLNYLAQHGHTSPFRHPHLQFRIGCPIFIERQLFKHQVGWAANSISGRYVDFSDTYWIPEQLRFQSKDKKQGSAGDLPQEQNKYFLDKINHIIEESKVLYKEMDQAGVAKEQCRIHLPLALETQFIWTGSLQAFIHLGHLRLKSDAQKETRDLVQLMFDQVKNHPEKPFEHSLKAFGL